jgi:pimeloyl-ACP methyl ester carboxylesterase
MSTSELASIDWQGRQVHIEYQWISPELAHRPLVVFLHEGLGSVSMWRDFPQRLCEAAGVRGLVYSRPGYGQSSPREPDERWAVDYMHRQAYEVLPALLDALRVDVKPWLFGHSDGGSIALLYAARFPASVAGLVVAAPHILVEEFGLKSIRQARDAYATTDLRSKLARHHADVDSAFWGWNHIWLDPAFEAWNIEQELPSITCPVLAVQGLDDEYGTLEQIRGIARLAPQTQLLELPACRHSPHRDQPDSLIDAVSRFIAHNHNGDTP